MKHAALACAAAALALLAVLASPSPQPPVPRPQQVASSYRPSDARLLDRRGETVHEIRIDASRRRLAWTPLAEVSPALIAAVIDSEDRRFFAHGGVDWLAVAAAAWQRLEGGPARGASTISMQLAALLDPALRRGASPRTPARKWEQMRAAWGLERTWSKAEILEAYLNLVTFRGELQGVAAAAAVLFDKQPHGLTAAESRVLAALLPAPNADRAALRRRVGGGQGVTPELLEAAVDRAVDSPRGSGPRVKHAPHAARRLLRPGRPEAVEATLDAAVQRFAADALRRHLLALRGRHVSDGAVLVADVASGEVLAYVGSSGDLSPAPEVDGVRARRQAGSSLKPFLYAAVLDQRLLTAASLLEDTPLEIAVGRGLYRPQNYDDEFRGLVSVRTALAGSLNVPAVRALQLLGVDGFAGVLRRLGFALDRRAEDYGPSLALGSADVSLWELVNAYRAVANGGLVSPLRLTPASEPGSGADGARVFSAAASFIAADILADRESRAVTFGLDGPLSTRFWTAVKTGTSKDMRDNWCIGFSARYVVGAWVGNFSGGPMHDVSGVSGAAPVWVEVMEFLHAGEPSAPPAPALGLTRGRGEWFLAGTEPLRAPEMAARPRILSPPTDSAIALDPDIPVSLQRVWFTARGSGLGWRLDGVAIGSGAVAWPPVGGRHRLELVDADGRVVDDVRFVVKSSGPGHP